MKNLDLQLTVGFGWFLPQDVQVLYWRALMGSYASYRILGSMGSTILPETNKTALHRSFANLPITHPNPGGLPIPDTIDPKAALRFVQTFGVLRIHPHAETPGHHDRASDAADSSFVIKSEDLMWAQRLLQKAWTDGNVTGELAAHAAAAIRVCTTPAGLSLEINDLWSAICVLFLRDWAAGKTAVCVNPDCPERYFIKRRSTQKICESGDCTAWAQRNYALKWWRNKGQKRRKGKAQA